MSHDFTPRSIFCHNPFLTLANGDSRNQFKVRERSGSVKSSLSLGQSSLEFLYAVGMALLVFSVAALLFFQSQQDETAIDSYLQSNLACEAVAGRISAVAAGGDGTVSYLLLPLVGGRLNYTVAVSAVNRTVSVGYGTNSVGCRFSTSNVSNGSSSSFFVTNNTLVRNINGGVLVG